MYMHMMQPFTMLRPTIPVLLTVFMGCLLGDVSSQPLPWPPLVTTCDVMPHIAADMTLASAGQLSCANSGWPECETINCNVVSTSEQLQIDLLPCWEYPALWLRGRDINGTQNVQHIFSKDSETFQIKIGEDQVTLNVTLVQRSKLTLGVEVEAGIRGDYVTLIPYRDIPLNTSFCPPGQAPLTCQVLQFIEQYVIVQNAARSHDPLSTPQCPRPDTAHCTHVKCNWSSDGPLLGQVVEMDLLPCAKLPAIQIQVSNEKEGHYFNHTFDKSEIVKLHQDVSLNVTVTHPQEGVIGLEVVSLDSEAKVVQVSFVRIPLPKCGQK